MQYNDVLEQLADAQYKIRLGLLFNLQQTYRQRDGSIMIDAVTAQGWAEALSTNYDDLPEQQKQMYRNIVTQSLGPIAGITELITDTGDDQEPAEAPQEEEPEETPDASEE